MVQLSQEYPYIITIITAAQKLHFIIIIIALFLNIYIV